MPYLNIKGLDIIKNQQMRSRVMIFYQVQCTTVLAEYAFKQGISKDLKNNEKQHRPQGLHNIDLHFELFSFHGLFVFLLKTKKIILRSQGDCYSA